MKRIFCFAMGNLKGFVDSDNLECLLKHIRKLDVAGVELTLSKKEYLYAFKLSNSNISWLRSLDYVSIHSPFNLVAEADGPEEVARQLDVIEKLYNDVNAKNVIIHPHNMPQPDLLGTYDFFVSTENMRRDRNITMGDMKKVFKKYPKIGFCLDVSHAYTWSGEETKRLIGAFGDRLSQIHFSGTYRGKQHLPLENVSRGFLSSIRPIKNLDAPLVIEEKIGTKNLEFVKDEIRRVKLLFP